MMESVKSVDGTIVRYEEEVDVMIDVPDFAAGPSNVKEERTLALVVWETEKNETEISGRIPSCAATAKAKRLACSKIEHAHLRKKKYKGFSRKREQYGIDADTGALETFHRSKLRFLLKSLMEQRRWTEACGVIGVLLNIPFYHSNPDGFQGCRSDYWAGMMLLRRIENTQAGAMRCRRMFRLLNRLQPNARCRGEIQVESALFLINQGDREAAYNELRPIADSPLLRDDPVVNLCHGLNTHCLWYEAAVEENSKKDGSEVRRDSSSRNSEPQEVMGETEAPEPSVGMSSGTERSLRGESPDGSVLSSDSYRYRRVGEIVRYSSRDNEDDANVWQVSQRSIYEETNEEGFVEGGEQVWLNATVPLSPELDPRLFPIRVIPHPNRQNQHYRVAMNDGRTRDFHAAAVKHLKQALRSAPDMLPALLPLVQLLLAVHDVKGAVQEIDRCMQALENHITPPSIKALLLESLKYKDYSLLEVCYQRILSLNPFAAWALKGLVSMHSSGRLKFEVLLDSIALHLDATSGSVEVWRKLSSSLLEVGKAVFALLEGSTKTEDTSKGGEESTPVVGREYLQGLLCSPRHQFWLKKHFSAEIMQKHQEESTGDRWLIAYKAACAAHIYGPQFHVVEQVCTYLERKEEDVPYKFVRRHRQKSLKLFSEQYNTVD